MQLFVRQLKELLMAGLPGQQSHFKMIPENVINQRIEAQKNAKPMLSSVLILFYPYQNETTTVLIQRHSYNGVHSNQAAFPGGKAELYDKDFYDTALREAQEELNIISSEVEILGKLSNLYVPPSNYLIQPVVGFCHKRPEFLADIAEVKEFFEVKLSELLSPEAKTHTTITFANGTSYNTPCYVWNDYTVWGATAMIISELIDVLKKSSDISKLFDEKTDITKN